MGPPCLSLVNFHQNFALKIMITAELFSGGSPLGLHHKILQKKTIALLGPN